MTPQQGVFRLAERTSRGRGYVRRGLSRTAASASNCTERMGLMCDFANSKTPEGFVHPVLRSIILHFWLAYDHPFVDGNGRVARALFYWSMLRHGYWLFEFVSISQIILKAPVKYGRAFLYTETDDNDLTYFISAATERHPSCDEGIARLHRTQDGCACRPSRTDSAVLPCSTIGNKR